MITKTKPKADISVIYGEPGVGKTTMMSQLTDAVFINIEDGIKDAGIDTLGTCKTYDEFKDQLSWLASNDHGKKNVVVDSITELEQLIRKNIISGERETTIETVHGGYGKGYVMMAEELQKQLRNFRVLRDTKDVNVWLIAHSKVIEHREPGKDIYDKVSINLDKRAIHPLVGMVDNILYCRFENDLRQEDQGFGKKKYKTIGDDCERIMVCQNTPYCVAKNRIGLDKFVAMDATVLEEAIKKSTGE